MPKITVIIPIYGVEEYIERCARSLFEQTLDDIEYIFVDDCTLDSSVKILIRVLEDYPQRKLQTRIERMPINSGLPAVRCRGIRIAKGDYIIHCDSDDWIDADMYRIMHEKAVEENADIVICDFYRSNGTIHKPDKGARTTEKIAYIKDMLCWRASWSVWNKLIKREIYNNPITYPKGAMAEDMALVLQLIYYCQNIVYVEKTLYYYCHNPNSICNSINPIKLERSFLQATDNASIVERFYKEKHFDKAVKNELVYAKLMQRNILLPLINDQKYYKMWVNMFPELFWTVIFVSELPLKKRLKFYLYLIQLYRKK